MLNYRLGTVNEKHWGFKPVFRCSKPHTFSTFSGEEKENENCPFIRINKATRELNKTKPMHAILPEGFPFSKFKLLIT